MHGAAPINRADKPVRPAILHNDGRAFRQADELAREYVTSPTGDVRPNARGPLPC
jgi:sugar (pentulose or hexulose) kinase